MWSLKCVCAVLFSLIPYDLRHQMVFKQFVQSVQIGQSYALFHLLHPHKQIGEAPAKLHSKWAAEPFQTLQMDWRETNIHFLHKKCGELCNSLLWIVNLGSWKWFTSILFTYSRNLRVYKKRQPFEHPLTTGTVYINYRLA